MNGMKLSTRILWLAAALLAISLAILASCNDVKLEGSDQTPEIKDLNDPTQTAKPEPEALAYDASPEEIWRNRCGECHAPEVGLDKYKGEQWEFVIAKMIKKENAHFTPQLAEKVYEYLYERTKNPGDPPFSEVIAGRSQWSTEAEKGS
ncbi:MAG: hypothetical protein HRF49_07765 [bacterium]|jgi:hypothetical protein